MVVAVLVVDDRKDLANETDPAGFSLMSSVWGSRPSQYPGQSCDPFGTAFRYRGSILYEVRSILG